MELCLFSEPCCSKTVNVTLKRRQRYKNMNNDSSTQHAMLLLHWYLQWYLIRVLIKFGDQVGCKWCLHHHSSHKVCFVTVVVDVVSSSFCYSKTATFCLVFLSMDIQLIDLKTLLTCWKFYTYYVISLKLIDNNWEVLRD